MIKSMTGFGKGEVRVDAGTITVEMTSVNSRYLDAGFKVPDFLESRTLEFKNLLKSELDRGRVKTVITYQSPEGRDGGVAINQSVLKAFVQQLMAFQKEMAISQPISIEALLNLPEVITVAMPEPDIDEIVRHAITAMKIALRELDTMRIAEGKNLADEITGQLKHVEMVVREIETLSLKRKEESFCKFKSYIEELSQDIEISGDRVIQEAAIAAKKMDITEECDRLYSHIAQFNRFFDSPEPSGKRMTFILQEMNREITTIGAKGESAEISHKVVSVKNELEKIREQAQNIL